jgi:hypothetical protein
MEIRYFSGLEGCDEKVVEILNTKLKEAEDKYNYILQKIHKHYAMLEKRCQLYDKIDPNILMTMDHYSADSLVLKMTMLEK